MNDYITLKDMAFHDGLASIANKNSDLKAETVKVSEITGQTKVLTDYNLCIYEIQQLLMAYKSLLILDIERMRSVGKEFQEADQQKLKLGGN